MPQFQQNRNLFFTRSESYYQKDKRILNSHKSYHIGRFFSLMGSGILAFGLLCKFIFNEEIQDKIPVITVSVSSVGGVVLIIGICFLAVTVYKTQIAIFSVNKSVTNTTTGASGEQNVTEIIATPHESIQNDPRNGSITSITINRSND